MHCIIPALEQFRYAQSHTTCWQSAVYVSHLNEASRAVWDEWQSEYMNGDVFLSEKCRYFVEMILKGAIIQLTDGSGEVQQSVLNQIRNLRSELPGLDIELVLHGDATESALRADDAHMVIWRSLPDMNVRLLVCQNALNSRQLSATDIVDYGETVSSAVAHIVIRQHEGWSYLKGGY